MMNMIDIDIKEIEKYIDELTNLYNYLEKNWNNIIDIDKKNFAKLIYIPGYIEEVLNELYVIRDILLKSKTKNSKLI